MGSTREDKNHMFSYLYALYLIHITHFLMCMHSSLHTWHTNRSRALPGEGRKAGKETAKGKRNITISGIFSYMEMRGKYINNYLIQ